MALLVQERAELVDKKSKATHTLKKIVKQLKSNTLTLLRGANVGRNTKNFHHHR